MLEKTNNKAARDLPLTNDRIKFPKVRLLGVSGEQIGIVENQEAKSLAKDQQLDLVLISDKSDPPVCRIIDYGKYKFAQEKKAKEARKKQQSVNIKEVKMRYNIEDHDYKVRINQATRFLQSGNKVKMTITFRGREIQHVGLALELFNKMASELSEVSELQQSPLREGKNVIMVLSPKK